MRLTEGEQVWAWGKSGQHSCTKLVVCMQAEMLRRQLDVRSEELEGSSELQIYVCRRHIPHASRQTLLGSQRKCISRTKD